MPYIGTEPVHGEYIKLDAISVSATTTFNLTKGSAAFAPATTEQCIVSVNGVIQNPNTSFGIVGSTIVFTDPLNASDVIDFIVVMGGDAINTGTPSEGAVQASHLSSNIYRDGIRVNPSALTTNTTIASSDRAFVAGDFSVGNFTLTVNGVLTVV
tara:strand:+ start:1790 stop:2254 length:465 start_codon:yes stop_codon:yes gene_type:complete